MNAIEVVITNLFGCRKNLHNIAACNCKLLWLMLDDCQKVTLWRVPEWVKNRNRLRALEVMEFKKCSEVGRLYNRLSCRAPNEIMEEHGHCGWVQIFWVWGVVKDCEKVGTSVLLR